MALSCPSCFGHTQSIHLHCTEGFELAWLAKSSPSSAISSKEVQNKSWLRYCEYNELNWDTPLQFVYWLPCVCVWSESANRVMCTRQATAHWHTFSKRNKKNCDLIFFLLLLFWPPWPPPQHLIRPAPQFPSVSDVFYIPQQSASLVFSLAAELHHTFCVPWLWKRKHADAFASVCRAVVFIGPRFSSPLSRPPFSE